MGTLFGFVLAGSLDKWWREMRRPDPFVVVEVGAGTGSLMASILEAEPDCLAAMRYVMVERSAVLRSEQAGRTSLVQPSDIFPLSSLVPGSGPLVCSMAEMPQERFRGVIMANELLDNLAVDLVELRNERWHHVCIGLSKVGELQETLLPIEDDEPIYKAARHFGRGAHEGSRLALQGEAQDWVRASLALLEEGRLVVFDYATDSRTMVSRAQGDWLRTYRNHRPGTPPYDLPGTQDITCDVAVDQLSHVQAPAFDRSQSDFLEAQGLRKFTSDAREVWHGRADIGDLAAVRARARVQESRELTNPDGLGRHRVLEWTMPVPVSEPDDSGA